MEGARVINIMADGTICDDLEHYIDPENPREILSDFVCDLLVDVMELGAKRLSEELEEKTAI